MFIYNHQEKGWDGYESEPMKYLVSSLKFAETVSSAALTELIDIVPENDNGVFVLSGLNQIISLLVFLLKMTS